MAAFKFETDMVHAWEPPSPNVDPTVQKNLACVDVTEMSFTGHGNPSSTTPTLSGVSPITIKVAILPSDLALHDVIHRRSHDGCNAEPTPSGPTRCSMKREAFDDAPPT